MNNLILNWKMIIVLLLVGFGVAILVMREKPKSLVKTTTKTELVKGREEVSCVKGKEEKRKEEKRMMVRLRSPLSNKDYVAKINYADSTLTLTGEIKKVAEDSVELFFNLAYFEKSFLRVDTIKIKQLDTLKIETEKIIVEEIPFYEKFWFGGIVGGALVLLIVIASGK